MAAARKAKTAGVGRGNWRSADLPDNVVTRTIIDRLHGVPEASHVAKATRQTIYDWCRAGRVRVAEAACRIADELEPGSAIKWKALVRTLSGLTD